MLFLDLTYYAVVIAVLWLGARTMAQTFDPKRYQKRGKP